MNLTLSCVSSKHTFGFVDPDTREQKCRSVPSLSRRAWAQVNFCYLADMVEQREVDDVAICRVAPTLEQEAATFAVQLEVKLITPGDSR